jgi:flagellar biogenesis protein FliO
MIDHRIICIGIIGSLASVAAADSGSGLDDARARLPQPDLLDLYVQQTAAQEPARAPEHDREVRHPERESRATAAAGEQQLPPAGDDRMLARRGGQTGGHLRDLVPLLSVLALIVVGALAVKRFMPGRRLLTGGGVVEIVARAPLSTRQSLVLVKLGQRLLLLGVSADRISTLSVVDDPDQVAMLAGDLAGQQPASISREFARSFAEAADSFDGMDGEPGESAGGHVRGLLDKVRRLGRREVA